MLLIFELCKSKMDKIRGSKKKSTFFSVYILLLFFQLIHTVLGVVS